METPEQPPKEEKKLTRAQRRYKERVVNEARQTYDRLTNRFTEFFLNHDDPEGPEVAEKMDQIIAQWKVQCDRLKLTPDARPMMEQALQGVVNRYLEAKKERQQRKEEDHVLHESKE